MANFFSLPFPIRISNDSPTDERFSVTTDASQAQIITDERAYPGMIIWHETNLLHYYLSILSVGDPSASIWSPLASNIDASDNNVLYSLSNNIVSSNDFQWDDINKSLQASSISSHDIAPKWSFITGENNKSISDGTQGLEWSFVAGDVHQFESANGKIANAFVTGTGNRLTVFPGAKGIYSTVVHGEGNIVEPAQGGFYFYSVISGAFNKSTNIYQVISGTRVEAHGIGAFAHSIGIIDASIHVDGRLSFNVSENTSSQTPGYGANSDHSAILGGTNHNIPSTSPRSLILGGNLIDAEPSTWNTVFMPRLRIGRGTDASIVQDDTLDQLLALEPITGEIKYKNANYWKTSGDTSINNTNINISNSATLEIKDSGSNAIISIVSSFLDFLPGALYMGSADTGYILFDNANTLGAGSGMWLFDNREGLNAKGIEYKADYTNNFVDRSIIDKGYADSHIGGNNVDSSILNPDITVHLSPIVWNNLSSQYEFSQVLNGWKNTGTTIVTNPIIEGNPIFNLGDLSVDFAFIKGNVGTQDASILRFSNYIFDELNIMLGVNIATTITPLARSNYIIGNNSFQSLTIGQKNIGIGSRLGDNIIDGNGNILFGDNNLSNSAPNSANNTGIGNGTIIGWNINTSGNIAIGTDSQYNVLGLTQDAGFGDNISMGYRSLFGPNEINSNGNINGLQGLIAIGRESMTSAYLNDVEHSIAIGWMSLKNARFERYNIVIGDNAGANANIGRSNIFMGTLAGAYAINGVVGAIGIGDGQFNIGIGTHTFQGADGGIKNTFIGTEAGSSGNAGDYNSGIGTWTLNRHKGHRNSGIGAYAGYTTVDVSGWGNTYIGAMTGPAADTSIYDQVFIIGNPYNQSSTTGYRPSVSTGNFYAGSVKDLFIETHYSDSSVGIVRFAGNQGMGYFNDYSVGGIIEFGDQWIPDKGYTDGAYWKTTGTTTLAGANTIDSGLNLLILTTNAVGGIIIVGTKNGSINDSYFAVQESSFGKTSITIKGGHSDGIQSVNIIMDVEDISGVGKSQFHLEDRRTVKKGIEYFDNYSPGFTDRSLIDKGYANLHLGGQLVNTLVQTPTATEDGSIISWQSDTSTYNFTSKAALQLNTFDSSIYISDKYSWIGDEDTYISNETPNNIKFYTSGNLAITIDQTGGLVTQDYVQSYNIQSYYLYSDGGATATFPTIVPNRSNTGSGLGGVTNALSLIVGFKESLTITSDTSVNIIGDLIVNGKTEYGRELKTVPTADASGVNGDYFHEDASLYFKAGDKWRAIPTVNLFP